MEVLKVLGLGTRCKFSGLVFAEYFTPYVFVAPLFG